MNIDAKIATPPEFVAIELWLDLKLTKANLFFLIKNFWVRIKRTRLKVNDEIINDKVINVKLKI